MKTNTLLSACSCFLCFILISGCDGDDNEFIETGPEIEWIQLGSAISYGYRSGVVSSYNFKRSFKVIKDSGEVEISLYKKGEKDNITTGTFIVENGKEYKVTVTAWISGRRTVNGSEDCFSVVFSSPNCRENYEIAVPSFFVPSYNEWMPDMNYCPESFSFGEVVISQ